MQCRRVRCGARAEEQDAKEEKQRGGADLERPFGKSPAQQVARPSAKTIPSTEPSHTGRKLGACAASTAVASCVLSPISARKKDTATVTRGDPMRRSSLPTSRSPRRVQRPNPMKESPAAARSTLAGTTSSAEPPTATASAWLRSVASATPPRTAPSGSRAASAKVRSWVLSPISAIPMRPRVVRNTVMLPDDMTA